MQRFAVRVTLTLHIRSPNLALVVDWAKTHDVRDMLDHGAIVTDVTVSNQRGKVVANI
jgi:hypothetical protein